MNVEPEDLRALENVVAQLALAWNDGDAARFAAVFANSAEQVNIFGAQIHGRPEIEEKHNRIFKTIYQGSANTLRLVSAQAIADGVLLARVSSRVEVPRGPMKGALETIISMLLKRDGGRWEIILFHNTRVAAK